MLVVVVVIVISPHIFTTALNIMLLFEAMSKREGEREKKGAREIYNHPM